MTEASGSFGGLVLPTNVALSPRGNLFLLDDYYKYFLLNINLIKKII